MQDNNTKQEKYTPIRSIADAEQRLSAWNPNNESTTDFPNFILNSVNTQTSGQFIFGNSSEYHNLASEFARNDLYKHAESIAIAGAEKYRYNADLLADIIKYGAQSQDWESCKKAFARLCSLDYKKWSWRCYTFSTEHILDLIEINESDKEEEYIQEAKKLIDSYKLLNDERAWVADAELYLSKGERNSAIETLKDAVKTVPVAPQCCLKLSDLLLEDGSYTEVIKYSAIGLRATAQDQPSASNAYLLYVSALAKDALIHQEELTQQCSSNKEEKKGFSNIDAVKSALLDYRTAKQLFQGRAIYVNNIKQRETILKAKSGIEDFDDDSDTKHYLAEQFVKQLLDKTDGNDDSSVSGSDY